ncbi:MAG: GGDEF domain-containing protein [Patescibacteria group bacterium]
MAQKSEIQKLKEEIKRLKESAYKDELSKLYNRHGFKEEAEKFLKEAIAFQKHPERRESFLVKNFALTIFDIDNFKQLNDTYGHQAGDEALKTLGKLILERIRDIDLAARWGGEEFILGLIGANENDAYNIADDIRKKIAETKFKYGKKILKFTVSGGVADFSQAKNFEDLFKLADKAMYKAKKQGKNKIVKSSKIA